MWPDAATRSVRAMTGSNPRYRLGVDVGGTHTDLVVLDKSNGDLLVEKSFAVR